MHRFAIGLFAVVGFEIRRAVALLRGGGQGEPAELIILGATIVCIPQPAIDVGHDENTGGFQISDALGEASLGGKVMRVVVVERNLVPVIPVKTERHTEEVAELLYSWHARVRRAP